MKQEYFTKDLTHIEGTYTNAIITNLNKINDAYNDKNVSSVEYKSLILSIVDGQSIKKTPGQKKFVQKINSKNSKDQLCFLIYSAQLNGSGNGVL